MNKTPLSTICQELKDTIESEKFLNSAKLHESDFTRVRKMPICDIIYFMCGSLRRSVQRELEVYFKAKGEKPVSRQAYAQAREKIRPEAIRDLNDLVVDKFETVDGEIETCRGYRLLSVDGSDIDLPNNSILKERFGYSSNGTDKSYAKGLAMTALCMLI